MNDFKSHFRYNKRQRNGILTLAFLILILQLIYHFYDFSSGDILDTDNLKIKKIQSRIDSLNRVKQQNTDKIYPFNPNYLTDSKAYRLGLNIEEIDRLFAFRKSGKFVNSAREFQKVTGINDSLLEDIQPFFKFPEWVKNKKPQKKVKTKHSKKKDLNKASATELQSIDGIGEKLSERIISYRSLLHGFSYEKQLYEVYYLDKNIADKVLEQFTVLEKPVIKKLNLNLAGFKDILHLPYIDYELTKNIFSYRNQNGNFKSVEDLKKIDSFPLDKFDRIALYLTAE